MPTRLRNSAPSVLLGRAEPRLFTPPLVTGPPGECGCGCAHTAETTRGFELAWFAEHVLGEPLLPWQRWLAIHALELRPDGGYRFRTVVVLVGRQSGKTFLLRTLALWRMYMEHAQLVLSVAQSLDIAREAWRAGCEAVQTTPSLRVEHERTSRTNGDEYLALKGHRRWKIAAANRSAGRGLSVDLLVMDELREQRSWDAWSALSKTTLARPDGMTFGISNAGDDESVVLNHLREAALGGTDPTLGIAEWSAPDGCDLDDPEAWAQSEPGLGYTITEQAIRSALATDPPRVFRTEILCQRVDSLADPPIPVDALAGCVDEGLSLTSLRGRVAVCVDVSPSLGHATLFAAAVGEDGRVRGELQAAWGSVREMVEELPGWVDRIRPRASGYFHGPADAVKADLARLGFEPITEATAACQGLAEQVVGRRFLYPGDALTTDHLTGGGGCRCRMGGGYARGAAVAGVGWVAVYAAGDW